MVRNGLRRNYHTRCLKNGASDGVIEVVDTIWYWYYFIFDSRKYGIFRDHSMVCYWYNINILHTFRTTNVLGTQSYAQILPTLTICHFMQRKNVVGWDRNDLNQFRFANLYIRPFIRLMLKFYQIFRTGPPGPIKSHHLKHVNPRYRWHFETIFGMFSLMYYLNLLAWKLIITKWLKIRSAETMVDHWYCLFFKTLKSWLSQWYWQQN